MLAPITGIGHTPQVAVLDEVQMLGDRGRGWAWTRALLGLPARELHVCGDPGALPLLRKLAAECGDELEVGGACSSQVFFTCTPLVAWH